MCESRVVVRLGNSEKVYEDIVYLSFEECRITLADIEGKRYVVEGFKRIMRIEADFIKHTMKVILE